MKRDDLLDDIPYSVAYDAHRGISFVPEKRATQERIDYANVLMADWEELTHGLDAAGMELLAAEFERYRAGYKKRRLAWLHSMSRCLSVMITGPSNFPTWRNEKANNAERNKLEECIEFRKRAKAAIMKKLHPEWGPILGSNPDAPDLLRKEIVEAEANQERMKRDNIEARKKTKAGKWTDEFLDAGGHQTWELSNNLANIKRMKARLANIEAKRARGPQSRDCDG